jgi:hypothetical protein
MADASRNNPRVGIQVFAGAAMRNPLRRAEENRRADANKIATKPTAPPARAFDVARTPTPRMLCAAAALPLIPRASEIATPCAQDEPYPGTKHTWKSLRWQAAKATDINGGRGRKVFVTERDNFATAAMPSNAFLAAFSRNDAVFREPAAILASGRQSPANARRSGESAGVVESDPSPHA